jgi:hypothetical protein
LAFGTKIYSVKQQNKQQQLTVRIERIVIIATMCGRRSYLINAPYAAHVLTLLYLYGSRAKTAAAFYFIIINQVNQSIPISNLQAYHVNNRDTISPANSFPYLNLFLYCCSLRKSGCHILLTLAHYNTALIGWELLKN